ncbi:MAG: 50S ribosomal protein L17, partial [Thermodesulfobacteriota bacterium]
MRHKRVGRKLGIKTKHRKSMFRNMATSLLKYDKIKTTDLKAKEIRRVVEKLITLAKKGTLESRRKAEGFLRDKEVVKKLFAELAERYKDRPGGYTRIIKLGFRKGDNSPISLIELIENEFKPKVDKKKTKAKSSKTENQEVNKKSRSSKKESAEELGLVDTAVTAKGIEEITEKVKESLEPEAKEIDEGDKIIDSKVENEPNNVSDTDVVDAENDKSDA